VTNHGGHGRFVLMATGCWPCSSAMVSGGLLNNDVVFS